jgi:hypothetical protein
VGEGLAKPAAPPPKAAVAEMPLPSVDRFAFGVSLTHGLDCAAEFHAVSPKEAEQLRQALRLFEAMLKGGQKENTAVKFAVDSSDGNFKLSLSIPEDEWKKALQAQRHTLAEALAARLGTAPAQPPPPQQRILTDANGNTVSVTLPGKR